MTDFSAPRRILVAAASTAAAMVLVAITHQLAIATNDPLRTAPEFGNGPAEPLRLSITLAATVVGAILGGFLALGAARLTPRPRPTFLAACAVGLVVYGGLAFARSEQTSTALWLNAMHIVAAVPIVGVLGRLLPSHRIGVGQR